MSNSRPAVPALQFDAILEREKGLHRGLSTGQLSMIAIGGAIGTGLFLGSGYRDPPPGPGCVGEATPLARLISSFADGLPGGDDSGASDLRVIRRLG